jgi:hypothetical protein
MQTAEFDYKEFEKGNREGDKRLAIRFFTKARQDMEASQEAGRPIFKEVDYIQVMLPGDRTQVNIRPVMPGDKVRWARQYEHWKSTKNNDVVEGTPLEAWNILSLAQIEEYRYFGVRTIEHMAELRDDIVGRITGATSLKQKAQAFLALAKDEAPLKKVQAELDKRDNDIAALKAAIEDQAKVIKQLQSERSKK